jgi:CRP-like cAMP-binding protein
VRDALRKSGKLTRVLTRKLECFSQLSDEDRHALESLCEEVREVGPDQDLIKEGEKPDKVFLLLEGWAFRYKLLPDGKRQILGYLVPGDLCDIHIFILKTMDHGIGLLSPAKVAAISPEKMVEAMDSHTALERALWWSTLVDEATLREWLVNLGQRDAHDSLAHLLCEIWFRMRAVGLASAGHPFSVPLTQVQLADSLGITPVAVSRALGRLRQDGLISLDQRKLTVHDAARLAAISGFEPNYLHLERAGGSHELPGVVH